MKTPLVSVVMPVYSGQQYIREAIDSILAQRFTDFEFLIIDDGSTDKSCGIIKSYSDPRIRLVQNRGNLGVAKSLNKGIKLARGKFVARMDCDDVSYPDRLLVQVKFLQTHDGIDVCGAGVDLFGARKGRFADSLDHELVKSRLLFRNALVHPSVMMRKSALAKNNFYYDPTFRNSEDYELWTRSIGKLRFINLSQTLGRYRFSKNQQSQKVEEKKFYSNIVRKNYLKDLGISVTTEELELHNDISLGFYEPTREFIEEAEIWFLKIQKFNLSAHVFDTRCLSFVLEEQWFLVCDNATVLGFWLVKKYLGSKLFYLSKRTVKHFLVILLKSYLPKKTR